MILNQTTVGELYQCLSPEEVKGLGLYLYRNTVGKNDILYRLHKMIAHIKVENKLKTTQTEELKAKLFGDNPQNTSKWTTYNNLLINHIKNYLLLSKIEAKDIYTETLWGEILIERGLKRSLLLKIANVKLDLSKDSYPIFKRFLSEREKTFYQFITFTNKSYNALITSQYRQFDAFNDYYKSYYMELVFSIYTFSRRKKTSVKLDIQEVEKIIDQCAMSENYILQIQALSLNLILDRDNHSYYTLMQIFQEKFEHISHDMMIQLTTSLLNYSVYKLNNGKEEFDYENYKLLNFLYAKKALLQQGIFSVVKLFTFTRLELLHGSIAKAEKVLAESLKVVSDAQKSSYQHLIEARICFAKEDYKLSLRKISTINPSDSIYYFPQYKIMLIKNYVMLANIDRLMAERENFSKYIRSHKEIPEDEKQRHKLFIQYTEYLTAARYEYLSEYMKRRIEKALLPSSPYFTEKIWLRERWEVLKKKGEE